MCLGFTSWNKLNRCKNLSFLNVENGQICAFTPEFIKLRTFLWMNHKILVFHTLLPWIVGADRWNSWSFDTKNEEEKCCCVPKWQRTRNVYILLSPLNCTAFSRLPRHPASELHFVPVGVQVEPPLLVVHGKKGQVFSNKATCPCQQWSLCNAKRLRNLNSVRHVFLRQEMHRFITHFGFETMGWPDHR